MGAQGSRRARYREPAALEGRAGGGGGGGGFTAVVTGANTGLGKETAARLAASGARVVFACRSEQRAREAMDDVLARGGGAAACRVEFMPLDLASFKSVASFARQYKRAHSRCDALVCNAAINGFTAKTLPSTITEDGFNVVWQANFLGHWLLARLLQPEVERAKGRVVFVSSCMHAAGDPQAASKIARIRGCRGQYESTKLASGLAARELTRRFRASGSGAVAHAATPGAVMTDIFRDMPNKALLAPFMRCLFLSPEQGASTSVAAATDPRLGEGSPSRYLVPYWHAGCRAEPLRTLFDTWGCYVGAIEGVASTNMGGKCADEDARELGRLSDEAVAAFLS